jgi:hypothetical protein
MELFTITNIYDKKPTLFCLLISKIKARLNAIVYIWRSIFIDVSPAKVLINVSCIVYNDQLLLVALATKNSN